MEVARDVCLAACDVDASCVADCAEASLVDTLKVIQLQDVGMAVGLLMLSALFSGLTLGLMSLDPQQLELEIAGGDEAKKKQAERILPVRKRGNLLLCTLLLGNTVVNSFIAILTSSFTSGLVGGIISTAFILIFGEVIPQSVCSRYGLSAGSKAVDIVRFFVLLLFPVAWPLSKVLDIVLGAELGTVYSRGELKELLSKQVNMPGAGGHKDGRQRSDSGRGGAGDSTPHEGKIGVTEATFMCGVLAASERTAEQIMTSMDDVFGLCAARRRPDCTPPFSMRAAAALPACYRTQHPFALPRAPCSPARPAAPSYLRPSVVPGGPSHPARLRLASPAPRTSPAPLAGTRTSGSTSL